MGKRMRDKMGNRILTIFPRIPVPTVQAATSLTCSCSSFFTNTTNIMPINRISFTLTYSALMCRLTVTAFSHSSSRGVSLDEERGDRLERPTDYSHLNEAGV